MLAILLTFTLKYLTLSKRTDRKANFETRKDLPRTKGTRDTTICLN